MCDSRFGRTVEIPASPWTMPPRHCGEGRNLGIFLAVDDVLRNALRLWTTSPSVRGKVGCLPSPWPSRFPLVPRGLSKGTGPRFHQGHRSPGAQPEIASKAVREDIEDRLHGQAAEHRCSGRARRATDASEAMSAVG